MDWANAWFHAACARSHWICAQRSCHHTCPYIRIPLPLSSTFHAHARPHADHPICPMICPWFARCPNARVGVPVRDSNSYTLRVLMRAISIVVQVVQGCPLTAVCTWAMYKSRVHRERSFSLSTIAVCTLYALCAHTAWYHRVRGASGWIDINDSVVI